MDEQEQEWAAYVTDCEAKNMCPFSGMSFKRCQSSICDCFREQFPDDPYGVHPEVFTVK